MKLFPCGKHEIKHIYLLTMCLCVVVVLSSGILQAQTDSGPRPGQAGAGSFFPGLNQSEQQFFLDAQAVFAEVDSVAGTLPGENGSGLGPGFNGNSCAQCHAQPAVGGSSPGPTSPQHPVQNPQVALATLDGARNSVPSFILSNGPVREARFVRNPDGSADGGVHDLYSIANRSDGTGCNLPQPNFAQAVSSNNVIFRIPTPTFGLGLVENTPDTNLRATVAASQGQRNSLGIGGTFNTSGNDGTITRFGWKAQNKSLLIFASEAYNVEQGVTNEGFPNERNDVNGCLLNATPEDHTHVTNPNGGGTTGTAADMSGDIVNFADFMRLSAPPTTTTNNSASAANGLNFFVNIGCAACHSTLQTTGNSPFTGMSNFQYHPYSDFQIHHMGSGLSDGVSQGAAGPDQFRTAPLWGAGQRLFFLHDGRTSNLMTAIQAHSSNGSEANRVIQNFNALPVVNQQNILDFLRSL
jgi:CxxC motif-containing protein (DUF1111 family)